MQSSSVLGAIAAGAVFVSGAACAQTAASQAPDRLSVPVPAPEEMRTAGLAWRCEGEPCLGGVRRPSSQEALLRECRKVVAVIGPVSSYRSRGRDLSHAQVRACNRSAAGLQATRY